MQGFGYIIVVSIFFSIILLYSLNSPYSTLLPLYYPYEAFQGRRVYCQALHILDKDGNGSLSKQEVLQAFVREGCLRFDDQGRLSRFAISSVELVVCRFHNIQRCVRQGKTVSVWSFAGPIRTYLMFRGRNLAGLEFLEKYPRDATEFAASQQDTYTLKPKPQSKPLTLRTCTPRPHLKAPNPTNPAGLGSRDSTRLWPVLHLGPGHA